MIGRKGIDDLIWG